MATYLSGSYGSAINAGSNGYRYLGIWYAITAETDTTITLNAEIWFKDTTANMSDSSNTLYFNSGTSATTSKGSYTVSITEEETLIATFSLGTFTKGTSTTSYTMSAKWADIGSSNDTVSVTNSFTVPVKTNYTVSYKANGGSGAPSSQTKWYGTTLTLSSTKPTRTGYTFKGWATSSTGSVKYSAGGSYTTNAAVTLYAVWSENALTVNYYSNGADYGTADGEELDLSSSSNVKVYTVTYYYDNKYSSGLANVQSTSSLYLSRTGYTPTKYWGTSTSGGTLVSESTSFSTGQALAEAFSKSLKTRNASVNVYAQWEENGLTIDYYSNYADYGTYQGDPLLDVSATSNTLVYSKTYLYDDSYEDGLNDIQNENYLYLSRTGYFSTGCWGTTATGGILIDEKTSFSTGQALAEALNLSLEDGNASIIVYAQWEPANVAYYKTDEGYVLCNTYGKVDSSWQPMLFYGKINGTYVRSVIEE